MSTAAEPKTCLQCGQPLGGLAPAGVCSRCLLLTGLDETNGAGLEQTKDRSEPRRDSDLPRRFGDYELLEEIARGGMGIVYKARQLSLDRMVAVKMLLFGQYTSEEFIHRFRIEASAAASLQHPNIVAIHEVGVQQGQHYFAMDLVDGPNLAQFIRDQPLPAKRAAAYVKAIAEAIQFAHQRRILHRDLKPSNILIDSNDQPRITDFGLAKRFGVPASAGGAQADFTGTDRSSALPAEAGTPNLFDTLTVTGQMLGSPSYMPPEQASVQHGRIGPHSDVYSMGAILYHTLVGRPPFVGETLVDTLQQVLLEEPIAPRLLRSTVPVDLETISLKCLEKEPARRYPTAQALADELGRFLRGEPIHARPVSPPEKIWRWCQRKPALAVSLVLALLLLLVLGIGSPIAALLIRNAQRTAEQSLYVANVHQANEALEAHDIFYAQTILQRIEQSKDQQAMRGWEWRYVAHRARSQEESILGRHESWLADLVVSPDRRRLATISEDGVAKLWDLATEKIIHSWSAHTNVLEHQPDWTHHAVVFTPDGSTLITAGEDGAVRFWNVNELARPTAIITNLNPAVNRLAISPDGKLLAGQGWRERVYLWRLTSTAPELIAELPFNRVVPYGISFSPEGRTLLIGWVDQEIARYDLSTPNQPREMEPLSGTQAPFAFSPDGHWLVTAGSSRHVVRRWAWPELTTLPDLSVQGGNANRFAISPDSRFLAGGLFGGQINFWELTNRGPQETDVLLGHEEFLTGLAFGPDDGHARMVSASADKTIRLWNLAAAESKEMVMRLGTPVLAVAISTDGVHLATVTHIPVAPGEKKAPKTYTLQLWDLKTRSQRALVPFGEKGLGPQIVFSPDSKRVAVTDFFNLEFFRVPSLEPEAPTGHRGLVYARDGTWLAYIGSKSIIKRASLDAPEQILINGNDFQQLALSPDGRTLASSTDYGGISLWDARDGSRIKDLPGHTMLVPSLAFAADGKTLVSAGWDGRLGIWDLTGKRASRFLRGHNNAFGCAALSPDGGTIATGGDDSTVRLWNVARREEIAVLHGHGDNVNGVDFSSDGRWLVSASDDRTVRFWEAPTTEDIEAAEKANAGR